MDHTKLVQICFNFSLELLQDPARERQQDQKLILVVDHSTGLDQEKCCTKSRTNLQENQLGQCCDRMVIGGKISAVKLTQEDFKKPLGFPLDRKFLHYFNTKIHVKSPTK